jgi:hypothetical protein
MVGVVPRATLLTALAAPRKDDGAHNDSAHNDSASTDTGKEDDHA